MKPELRVLIESTSGLPLYNTRGISVQRYSWTVFGGPKSAELILQSRNPFLLAECLKWVRFPVEIQDDQGRAVWWGFVYGVRVHIGNLIAEINLDNMWNSITVQYTSDTASITTEAGTNATSIATFGTKELKASGVNLENDTAATQYRDRLVDYYGLPRVVRSYSENNVKNGFVEITCRGWFETLDWRYYTDTDTTATASSTQIENIIASVGGLLGAVDTVPASGVTTMEYRDGNGRAGDEIRQLMELGVSGGNRYTATVRKDKTVKFEEEPTAGVTDFYIDHDGSIKDSRYSPVLFHTCPVGHWLVNNQTPLFNVTSRVIVDTEQFFIVEAEYDNTSGTYRPLARGQLDPLDVGGILVA